MQKPLSVLNIEDSEKDSKLIARQLKKAGYKITFKRVETADEMQAELTKSNWDIIISGHNLARFDSFAALALVQDKVLDIPFIVVTDKIDAETAAAIMKAGAHDYLMKNNLMRLPSAIELELEYAKVRQERKQARDASLASEKRFRALIENSLDNISLLSADGTLLWESPSVIRNLDYDPNELVGTNMIALLHPDDLEQIQNLFAELANNPASRQSGTFRLRRKDGNWRWVDAIASNLLHEPSIQAIVISYRDVTERKTMENEIASREQNYRSIMAQASDGIFTVNSIGKFTDINPSGCDMLGYTRNELLAKKIADLFPPDDLGTAPLRIDELRQGKTLLSERRLICKDGTLLKVEINVRMLSDGSFQGILHDISERKQAEDSLRESEQNYRFLYALAERREQERALIDDVSAALAHELDLTRILQTVVEAITKTFGYTLVSLYLLQDETLVLQHQVGYSNIIKEIPIAKGVTGRVARSGLPLLIEDVHTEREFVGAIENIVSEVCVPLLYDDRVIGVLNVESTRETKLSEADLNLMISLSKQISPAIGRAKLYTEVGDNEKRFRALIENSADAIALLDAQGTVTYDSPAAPGMLGYDPEERIGKSIFELIHADDIHEVKDLLQKLTETKGARVCSTFRLLHKNTSWRWMEAVATNLLDEPSVKAIVVNYRDITDRKQMEELLHKNEDRFNDLANNIQEAFWMTDIETGRDIYLNPAAENIWGKPVEELLASPESFLEFVLPEDRQAVNSASAKHKLGEKTEIEYRVQRADSSVHWVWDRAFPIHNAQGKVTRVAGLAADITERKKLEIALLQSEQAHRTLFENVPVGLYRTSADGYWLDANPALIKMFGYEDRASFLAVKVEDVYVDPVIDKEFLEVVIKTDTISRMEAEFRKKDGTTFWAEDHIQVVRDENGNPLFYEGSLTDITERKRTGQILAESESRYRQAIAAADAIPYSRNYALDQYTFIGDGITKLAGYSPEEITPALLNEQIVESIIYGNYQGMALSEAVQIMRKGEGGTLWRGDYRVHSRSGEERWISDSSIQILDEKGIPEGSIGILLDITERKQDEVKLLESERRYRSLFEDSPVALWEEDFSAVKLRLDLLKSEGVIDFHEYFGSHPQIVVELISLVRIVDVNKATMKLFGAKEKTELLLSLTQLVDTNDDRLILAEDDFENQFISIAQGKSHFEWDSVNQTLDDRNIFLHLSLSVMEGHADTYSKVIISMTDITESRQAEEALRKSEENYRGAIEAAGLVPYVIDYNTREFTFMGENILKLTGYTAAEFSPDLLKESVLESHVWEPQIPTLATDELQKRFRSGTISKWGNDLRIRTRSGEERWLSDVSVPILDKIGNAASAIGVFQDLTERKKAEDTLEQRARELQILYETSLDINSQTSLETLLASIVERAASLLGTNSGGLYLMEPDGQSLKLVVGHNLPEGYIGIKLMLGEGLSGQVAQSRTPINLDDYQTWPERASVYTNSPFHRILGVPLKVEDRVIGVINITDYELTGLFSEDQVRLASLFAEQAALAIDRARLYEEERARRRELDILYDSAMAISSNLTLEIVIETVVEQMTKALNTSGCTLSFWDQEQDNIVIKADYSPTSLEPNDPPGKIYSLKEYPITRRVLETREPVLLIHNDPKIDQAELNLMNEQGMSMVLLLPLVIHNHVIGLMEVYETEKRDRIFTEDEMRLAQSLSIQTAIFIENARLYESVQIELSERKRAEEKLRESEDRFKAIFMQSPLGITVSDSITGHFFQVNPRYAEIAGRSMEEMATLDWSEFTHPDDVQKDKDQMELLLAGKIGGFQMEKRYIKHDGRVIWINMTIAPLNRGDNDHPRHLCMIEDITERKRADQAIRESEALYRQAIEVAGGVPYHQVYNLNGVHVYYHFLGEGIRQITGYGPEEFDAVLWDSIIEESHPVEELAGYSLDEAIQKVRLGEIPIWKCEFKIRRRDGGIRWVFEAAVELHDEHGVSNGSIGIFQDITERKQAEDALRDSEQRYRTLFEDVPVSIWEEDFSEAKKYLDSLKVSGVTDIQTYFKANPEAFLACGTMIKVLNVNQATLKMYGAETKDDLYKSMEEGLSESEVQHLNSALVAIAEGKISHSWEGADKTVSGEPIQISLSWSVSPGHESDFSKVIVTTINITERKKAEEALRKSEERFRAIFEGAAIGIALVDLSGHTFENNLALENLLGYDSTELRSMNFTDFTHPDDVMLDWNLWQDLLSRRRDTYQIEKRFIHKNGHIIWVNLASSSVLDADGQILFGVGMVEDITERKKAEGDNKYQLSELEALYENGLAISRLLEPRQIAQRMVEVIDQKLDWHHAAIRLYDAPRDRVELLALNFPGLNQLEMTDQIEQINKTINTPDKGLSGWVVRHGEVVRIGNIKLDPRYIETYPGILSGLYVPIKSGENVIGSIAVESEKLNAFTERDAHTLTTLASQAAISFINARLYLQIQKELKERHQAEEEVRKLNIELEQRVIDRTAQIEATKRRLELATHAGQIGVWEYNPRENKVIWDERMHIIHQLSEGEFDGTSEAWAQIIHPEDLGELQLNRQLTFTKYLATNNEHRIIWRDGSVRYIMASAVMAFSPEGISDRLIGINMDITDRKNVEQSLRESENYARLLFEAVPDPVSVTEIDDSIVDINKVFERQFGILRDEVRGKRISVMYSPAIELEKREKYLSEIQQGQTVKPVELEYYVPGDRIHTLELHSYPLKV